MRVLLAGILVAALAAPTARAAVDLRPRTLRQDTFAPAVIAVGDLGGDAAPDVLLAGACGRGLVVMGGSRPVARRFALPKGCPQDAVVADMDRDGTSDVVLTTGFGGDSAQVTVLYRGAHAERRSFAVASSTDEVVVADFDGDGRRDIVVTESEFESGPGRPTTDRLLLLVGAGPRAFAAPVTVATGVGPVRAAVDLDGDSRVDLVAGGSALVVLRGNGDGTFRRKILPRVQVPTSVWFGRFDADARPDVLVTTEHRLWLVRGERRLRARPLGARHSDGDALEAPVTAGDLNGDQRPDVVLPRGDDLDLYAQDRHGGLRAPVHYRTGGGWPVVLDLDRDGRRDVLVVGGHRGDLRVLFNRGRAQHARLRVAGGPVPYIATDRTLRVPVRCSPGISGCRGNARVGRGRAYFDLLPGQRDALRVRVKRLPQRLRRLVVRTETGRVETRIAAHPATAAERRAGCAPRHVRTLARSPAGRVFRLRADAFAETPLGCLRALGGWIPLPVDFFDGPTATRGRWAAFNQRDCGEGLEGCYHDIHLFDLRARRSRGTTLNVEDRDPACSIVGGDCGAGAVGSLDVDRQGSLAWIACPESLPRPRCPRRENGSYEVYVLDASGKRRVDAGRDIDPHSLRITHRTATWRRAGGRRHARLHGTPLRGRAGLRSPF